MVNMITALCGYFSGTFVCDTGGTFKSDTPGTFVSDIGGTFEVILSNKRLFKLMRIKRAGDNRLSPAFFIVRPARTYSNGCKSPTRPNSGKRPANDKGVHREV